jgi:tripartite-type tricarboxylate transporter receptor subunit TctC
MLRVVLVGVLAVLGGTAVAQGYPAKPIRFIVPFPPGGGTVESVVKPLNDEVNQVLRQPDVRSRLAAEGGDLLGGTPGEFSALLKTDLARWGAIVKQSGAKVD